MGSNGAATGKLRDQIITVHLERVYELLWRSYFQKHKVVKRDTVACADIASWQQNTIKGSKEIVEIRHYY